MSGTNAHVIIEEAPERTGRGHPGLDGGGWLWLVSSVVVDGEGVDGVGVGGVVLLLFRGWCLVVVWMVCVGQAERLRGFVAGDGVGVGVGDVGLSLACRPVFGDRAVVVGGDRGGVVGWVGCCWLVVGLVVGVVSVGCVGGWWVGVCVSGSGFAVGWDGCGLLDESPVFGVFGDECDGVLSGVWMGLLGCSAW